MEASLESGTALDAGRLVSAAWEGWWYAVDTTPSMPPLKWMGAAGWPCRPTLGGTAIARKGRCLLTCEPKSWLPYGP